MKLNFEYGRFAYVIRLCVLYFMLVLFVSVPLTLSRYTSDAAGTSTGQVAKFDVNYSIADSQGDTQEHITLTDLYPGTKQKYQIIINNNSDVSIEYTLNLETLNALPLVFSLDGVNYTSSLSKTNTIALGSQAEILDLYIKWDANQNDIKFTEEIDLLIITLHYEQID
ncbi:MAG: hypothetical protein IJ489_04325 [Clostridia bacterium]|nr:hypothetical protein [Clostridia bacterium]